jgi:hypothetical protein
LETRDQDRIEEWIAGVLDMWKRNCREEMGSGSKLLDHPILAA